MSDAADPTVMRDRRGLQVIFTVGALGTVLTLVCPVMPRRDFPQARASPSNEFGIVNILLKCGQVTVAGAARRN
ncbi:hypothetical protein DLJ49_05925 [Rhodovulum sp. 12E13]|uniref:hypothetical protein n=1 Tax=Rhodovulum sp. 12E13 TaxID=2203891 RepID=UPI000E18E170|nr:hypothetical protein [Rhodovulum sp. 12E13]RDC73654.1 hypothetical protein DLJ49_05925 [Rhodovulum sp. 12E13]